MDVLLGVAAGIALTLLFLIITAMMFEQYMRTQYPFQHATVEDFQPKREGG